MSGMDETPKHKADNLRKMAAGLLEIADRLDAGDLKYTSGGFLLDVDFSHERDFIAGEGDPQAPEKRYMSWVSLQANLVLKRD